MACRSSDSASFVLAHVGVELVLVRLLATAWLLALAVPGQVGQRLAPVVHNLVRALDEVVQELVHLEGLLVLVEVAHFALLVAKADVLGEEVVVDGVHDL